MSAGYWPIHRGRMPRAVRDSDELESIGGTVSMNTQLQGLSFHGMDVELADAIVNNRAFFIALKRNTSIKGLTLLSCELSEGIGREILNNFVVNNIYLTALVLSGCALGNGGASILAKTLTSCTSLQTVMIGVSGVEDGILQELVLAIRGMHRLHTLVWWVMAARRDRWQVFTTILQDPTCNLCQLVLSDEIDDDIARVLANSLNGNSKLMTLQIDKSSSITHRGWQYFSNLLCKISNVHDTYFSNHTLNNVVIRHGENQLPASLSLLLKLNRDTNKKRVAIQKIVRHYHHLDMKPFLEWDLKLLPIAINWFHRASGYVENNEGIDAVHARKLSAIFQYALAKPMMFAPVPKKKAGYKRKAGQLCLRVEL